MYPYLCLSLAHKHRALASFFLVFPFSLFPPFSLVTPTNTHIHTDCNNYGFMSLVSKRYIVQSLMETDLEKLQRLCDAHICYFLYQILAYF